MSFFHIVSYQNFHNSSDPEQLILQSKTSVADPDPRSGAFWTPESEIRNRFFPDPGSQTQIFYRCFG
jgi:hypothetical protein